MNLVRKYLMKYLWHRCNLDYRKRMVVVSCPPRELWIEPTNCCNLRCVMCPHCKGIKTKQGFMGLEIYAGIMHQLKDLKIQRINLFLGGESLLHKKLIEMLDMARDARIPVRLHTNATLLSVSLSEAILNTKALEEISFSFDAEDKALYERMRRNAKYEKTLDNIMSFLKMKMRHGFDNPRVLMQVIKEKGVDGMPGELSGAFKALFKAFPIDKFQVIPLHNFGGTLETDNDLRYELGRRAYRPCRHPWRSLSVAWDGEVVGCCIDMEKKLVLGDLKSQSVMEVWNGEPMRSFRKALADGRYNEIELCRDCDQLWS